MNLNLDKLIADGKKISKERIAEIEKRKIEEDEKQKQIELEKRIRQKIPTRFYNSVPDTNRIAKSVIEYSQNFFDNIKKGVNLGIAGDTGTGKTFDIFYLLKKYKYTNFQYVQLNVLFEQDVFQKDAKVIFIDDIDKVPTTRRHEILKVNDWYIEQLYYIVDYRYRNLLPIFFTTNQSKKGLLNLFGDALVRRLIENAKISVKKNKKNSILS